MIQTKADIKCADFESAIRRAIVEVDEMKHATPQAKDEMYRLLIELRDELVNWEPVEITIPAFMELR